VEHHSALVDVVNGDAGGHGLARGHVGRAGGAWSRIVDGQVYRAACVTLQGDLHLTVDEITDGDRQVGGGRRGEPTQCPHPADGGGDVAGEPIEGDVAHQLDHLGHRHDRELLLDGRANADVGLAVEAVVEEPRHGLQGNLDGSVNLQVGGGARAGGCGCVECIEHLLGCPGGLVGERLHVGHDGVVAPGAADGRLALGGGTRGACGTEVGTDRIDQRLRQPHQRCSEREQRSGELVAGLHIGGDGSG